MIWESIFHSLWSAQAARPLIHLEQAAPAPFDYERTAATASAAAADPAATASTGGLSLHLGALSKRYGERRVLHDIDLQIAPGEFVAIVGRSGCGKSTLLRMVAGLEAGSEGNDGELLLGGQPGAGLREDVRIMFQDARLLPWRSVLRNAALGLPSNRLEQARQVLAQVGLGDREGDWPTQLSGGQRQRVALARALVHHPRLLLLDEPLGALDALTRIEMHALIEGLWRQHGFTAILVTHDVQEAVVLADRVILIEQGRIALDQRIDLPRPRERGSAEFARIEAQILARVLGDGDPAGAALDDAADVADDRGGWPQQGRGVDDATAQGIDFNRIRWAT